MLIKSSSRKGKQKKRKLKNRINSYPLGNRERNLKAVTKEAAFLHEKIPASKLKNLLDICTIQLDSTQNNTEERYGEIIE